MSLLLHNISTWVLQEPDLSQWGKIWPELIKGLLALAGIGFASWLAYRFALKQKKKENSILLEKVLYEKKLQALEACWALLAYLSDTENPKSIIVWIKQNGSPKQYFLRKEQAMQFMNALPNVFYDQGNGVYVEKETKELLFKYRSGVYSILLATKDDDKPEIKKEVAEGLIQIHRKLIENITPQIKNIVKLETEKES